MNFTAERPSLGQQLPRIAFVTLLHVLVLGVVIQGGRHHLAATPPKEPTFTPIPPDRQPPPEPTPPPKPKSMQEPQKIIIPPPVIDVTPPPKRDDVIVEKSDRKVLPPPPPTGGGRDDPTPVPTPGPTATPLPVRVAAVVDARNCSKPDYPPKAYRNGQAGTVTLQMLIGLDGKVVDSKIEKSSGYKDLDIAAREGLSLCKFKPGTIDGVPQQSWTKIQYAWEILD